MKQLVLLALLLVLVSHLFTGCDNEFTPKTEFNEELIVYCVLSNTLDMQVIRLSTTYDAELGDVDSYSGRTISSAQVEIREGGNLYVFTDTMLTLANGTQERVWVNRDLVPTPEKQYRLKVVADEFPEATSTLRLPSAPFVRMQVKHTALSIDSVVVYSGALNLIYAPKGFYSRLFLIYRDTLDGQYVDQWAEVPYEELSNGDPVFTEIGREKVQGFSKYVLNKTLYSLTEDESRFDRVGAAAYMFVIDGDFYNYFKLVRGFDDPASIRLDKPDYTNIDGARGVFGGVYRDTTYTQLYKFFRP